MHCFDNIMASLTCFVIITLIMMIYMLKKHVWVFLNKVGKPQSPPKVEQDGGNISWM